MTTQSPMGQRGRLIVLVLYLVGLLVASWLAFGTWMPPTSEKGIWFYAALAALLLGSLLVTPYFSKPADAISYAVASLVTLLAFNAWREPSSIGFDRFTWSAATLYIVLVLVAGIAAISLKDSPRPLVRNTAQSARLMAETAGSPRAVFSTVFMFALVTYHRNEPREYLVIGIAWAVFVGLRPLENIASLWRRWRTVWITKEDVSRLGKVMGHDTPGLVLIREDPASVSRFGDMILARTEGGLPGLAVALDHVGFANGRWLRAICLQSGSPGTAVVQDAILERAVCEGFAFTSTANLVPDASIVVEDMKARLIGLVAPDTNIGQLHIELVRADLDVQEGSLVEVEIRGRPVLYQVIKGVTREEILQEKNTRGFVRAQAKKIGFWNSDRHSFDPVPWLPQPNQRVLLVRPKQGTVQEAGIGHFPGTDYPVSIDPPLLVTHNAAILGILGVGKSYFALELVERMIGAGIKVICLDLTNQYATELASFLDLAAEEEAREELAELGPAGKTNMKKNVEEGGSIGKFTETMKAQIKRFLGSENRQQLRVLNPAQFEVWRQDSKPYGNEASMATLTPTEVARIITESCLEVVQEQGMTKDARCCIVYEEAHSLIPEWNAVASDGDKAATNGTAKAILQGRKFGLGCLVITQRTANVTKSILNQCNTVFALRVFDATGMEFLKNYVGEDYSSVLSTLEDRHAVVFGRASSCRDPVLVRLNDRGDFTREFRKQQEPSSDQPGINT